MPGADRRRVAQDIFQYRPALSVALEADARIDRADDFDQPGLMVQHGRADADDFGVTGPRPLVQYRSRIFPDKTGLRFSHGPADIDDASAWNRLEPAFDPRPPAGRGRAVPSSQRIRHRRWRPGRRHRA